MQVQDLLSSEYDESSAYYLELVPEGNLLDLLDRSRLATLAFFESIPEGKHEYRYAPDKWTIKGVVQHLIDVERIFAYRALRFAREEQQALCGFDVDDYGKAQRANRRKMSELLEDYSRARQSTLQLFRSFDEAMLKRGGVASGNRFTVRALGFKLIGHDRHHCKIVQEKYLSSVRHVN